MKKTKIQTQQGFTLIELLIVMAIIAMLAGLVAPRLIGKLGGTKVQAAATQIKMLEDALDAHRLDVGSYPRSLEGLLKNEVNSALWAGPYLRREVPKDPWQNTYQYQTPGKHNKDFDLYSYGADGREGGEGENADIINW